MKILHLVSGNLNSGAFLGTLNLHEELLKKGVNSFILNDTLIKNYKIKNYYTLSQNPFLDLKIKIINLINNSFKFCYLNRENETFNNSLYGMSISNNHLVNSADIIHIHWIGKTFSSLSFLDKIKKPVIWTLRDMWAFTGGCHYSLGCLKFSKKCGSCRILNTKNNFDLSNKNFLLKKEKINRKKILFVAISKWLKEKASLSPIINNKVKLIYSGVKFDNFYPVDGCNFLKKYKIPIKKKLIVFGSQNINAKYKGLEHFISSIQYLEKSKFFIIFFGSFHDKSLLKKIKIPYICLNKVNSLDQMRQIFSIASVFVMSSIEEAFGKATVESLLCGTPVVCFKNTALEEIVKHKINGYTAEYKSSKDLAKGIVWCTEKNKKYFKNKCLNISRKKFDIKSCADNYIQIYKKILKN